MIEKICSKFYPLFCYADTITGNDGFSLYLRRSAKDNGRTISLKVKNKDLIVENRWIFLYPNCFSKHSKHIAILSTAISLSQSNKNAMTLRMDATLLYLVLQLLMPTMIFRKIR